MSSLVIRNARPSDAPFLAECILADMLASPISFVIMLLYIPLIAIRIRNEEKVLEEGLEGYKEYKQKVKYKVIPFIW